MKVDGVVYVPEGFTFEVWYGKPKHGMQYPQSKTYYEVPTLKKAKRIADHELKWDRKLNRTDTAYIVIDVRNGEKKLLSYTVVPIKKSQLSKYANLDYIAQ